VIQPLRIDTLSRADTEKGYFEGTHRSVCPQATWEKMSPLLSDFGITRLANVTGLDRIGIPVYMCCRPNSRSLAVSQGKGVDEISAKVSALMESVESWHAEYTLCDLRLESFDQLKRKEAICDPDVLPQSKGSLFTKDRPIPWARGTDLLNGEVVWVPYELVHANATIPAVPGGGCFLPSTNGLASGNTQLEAILHGIYEVVERDAVTLWELATPDRWTVRRVDCDSIDDSSCRQLLLQYALANISVMVWDITSDIGLPVFVVIISDNESSVSLRPMPAAFGSGCHCDRKVALSRALTEAAQSRLTSIAGSRDDLTRTSYKTTQSEVAIEYHQKLAHERVPGLDFRQTATLSSSSFAVDLEHVLERLRRIFVERVVVVDLSRPNIPANVVRVVVPGLEGPTESQWFRPGRRLEERLR
jgi:YcaO-like protein with predicted kinase domain